MTYHNVHNTCTLQAMASAGIIPGIITCFFSGGVAVFGLYLLSRCATHTEHRRSSFFAVAKLTFPRAAVFFDAAIAIKCFGVSIRWVSSSEWFGKLLIVLPQLPYYHQVSDAECGPLVISWFNIPGHKPARLGHLRTRLDITIYDYPCTSLLFATTG